MQKIKGYKRTNMINHIRRKLGADKELNRKLKRIKEEFDSRTAGVEEFWDLGDFLKLLDLAEYDFLGKSKAIIYAFKVGYLSGKKELRSRIEQHFGMEGK